MIQITNARRFVVVVGGLLLIIVALALWFTTANVTMNHSGQLVIEEGTSATAVWNELHDQEFTSSTLPWRYHAWRMDAAQNLKAGTYQIEANETVRDVIARLVAGDSLPDELTITYPEGFTLQQIAERTANRHGTTVDDFIAAAQPAQFAEAFPFLAEIPAGRDLEGYLFPDTYRVFEDDSASHIITRMLANFDLKVTDDLRQEIAAQGRTLDQVIIMASIIEREVISDDDMATVSGVLWKRHDEGMGLDADATVRYALNKWDGPLTVQDLAIDSPYNTRRYRGLPPSPISNPGIRAIIAAVRPEESEYYYYLSAPNGETIFSKTNDEHNANKAEYLR